MNKAAAIVIAVMVIAALFSSCRRDDSRYEDENNFIAEPIGRREVRIIEYLDFTGRFSLNIPPRIGNRTVTEIGEKAFADFWFFELAVPNTVVRINDWAFSGNYIQRLRLSRNLTEIGNGAFMDNRLLNVVIPDSVRRIGYRAFFWNPLESITIGANVEFGELSGENEYEGAWRFTPFEGTGFEEFYIEHGRRAGTYTFNNGYWSVVFR